MTRGQVQLPQGKAAPPIYQMHAKHACFMQVCIMWKKHPEWQQDLNYLIQHHLTKNSSPERCIQSSIISGALGYNFTTKKKSVFDLEGSYLTPNKCVFVRM